MATRGPMTAASRARSGRQEAGRLRAGAMGCGRAPQGSPMICRTRVGPTKLTSKIRWLIQGFEKGS